MGVAFYWTPKKCMFSLRFPIETNKTGVPSTTVAPKMGKRFKSGKKNKHFVGLRDKRKPAILQVPPGDELHPLPKQPPTHPPKKHNNQPTPHPPPRKKRKEKKRRKHKKENTHTHTQLVFPPGHVALPRHHLRGRVAGRAAGCFQQLAVLAFGAFLLEGTTRIPAIELLGFKAFLGEPNKSLLPWVSDPLPFKSPHVWSALHRPAGMGLRNWGYSSLKWGHPRTPKSSGRKPCKGPAKLVHGRNQWIWSIRGLVRELMNRGLTCGVTASEGTKEAEPSGIIILFKTHSILGGRGCQNRAPQPKNMSMPLLASLYISKP